MTCPACGAILPAEANFCSRCGAGLGSTAQSAIRKPKWYYNVWFVLFMLFFVAGPLGLPLVWKNPRFSRPIKLILSLIMVIYTIWLIDLTIRMYRAIIQHVDQFNSTLSF